jgi:hypothetical protein
MIAQLLALLLGSFLIALGRSGRRGCSAASPPGWW